MAAVGADISLSTPINFGWLDFSNERSSTTIYVDGLVNDDAAGNIQSLVTDVTGKYDILKTGLVLLTKLNHTKSSMLLNVDQSVESLPADETAQREAAIRWSYVDDVTGKKYRFDTPAPAAGLRQSGTDSIDLVSNIQAAAWVAIFEANAVSVDGNAVTMVSARYVGRRS